MHVESQYLVGMVHDMTEIPHTVERLFWPGMILGISAPLQYHASTLIVTGVGEVMRESIANIVDVVFVLPQVEMTTEYLIVSPKVLDLDVTMVWHLHHGVHLEIR